MRKFFTFLLALAASVGMSFADPVSPVTAARFLYTYDCQRNPAYPKQGSPCTLRGFSDPYVGYNGIGSDAKNTPFGPWKLEFVANYTPSNDYGCQRVVTQAVNQYYSSLSNQEKEAKRLEVPIFRLWQYNIVAGEYQHAAYGIVCAYADEGNAEDHGALFISSAGNGCFLAGKPHNAQISLSCENDLTTGLNNLVTAASATDPDYDAYMPVILSIDAIGTVELTQHCKDFIEGSSSAYNALTDAQKGQVTNYQVLVDAKNQWAPLVAEAKPYADAVVDLINAIPNPIVYTQSCKNKIDAAQTAYDALTDGQKIFVSNYETLKNAPSDLMKAAPYVHILFKANGQERKVENVTLPHEFTDAEMKTMLKEMYSVEGDYDLYAYSYDDAVDISGGKWTINPFTGTVDVDGDLSKYDPEYDMIPFSLEIALELPPYEPEPQPTYLDADFAIDFRTNPYTVVGGGALPDGVTVDGSMNTGDATHGYSQPVITIPVTAGNYLVKMGTCQFSNADGSVKNEDGSVTYTTLATNNGTCYHQNTSKNVVAAIITIPSDQIIKVHGAQYTPYFSIEKMPEMPAFTDFAINFMSDSYTVAEGTQPAGTVIDGTPNTGQTAHGYQNVVATVPVKAGKYRLTLGTCQYGTGTGNVMSETNIELASFDQKTAACYHQNPAENIISMIFDVDQDQHITIDCGNYTPYMKLEAVTAYQVSFALSDAEGTAPTVVDVTIGENITMPVNKTMYKEGYTLTGWSDGVNTYPIGESFTPANDVVLTPVFTANEADLLNASSDVTVKWYFGGDNGAPTTSYEGTSGLLVAQATIGDKTVDVKLSIDATSGKFAPQPDTEWAQVNVGTIFTYPYKEGMTVKVGNYKSKVTYYIADAEGKVVCYGENDYYSYIQVTYPASLPTGVEDVQSDKVQATKFFRDGQLLIERDGKIYNAQGAQVR